MDVWCMMPALLEIEGSKLVFCTSHALWKKITSSK